jgi:hypothetical protein
LICVNRGMPRTNRDCAAARRRRLCPGRAWAAAGENRRNLRDGGGPRRCLAVLAVGTIGLGSKPEGSMTRKLLMIAALAAVALTSSLGVGSAEARGWGYRGWAYHHYWAGYAGWRGWGPHVYYAYWGPRWYGYWGPRYAYAYAPYRVYYRCGC